MVADFLKQQGMESAATPREVRREDITMSTHIISMGCALDDLPLQGERVEQWDDVPPVSQDFEKAWAEIRSKVERLMERLA